MTDKEIELLDELDAWRKAKIAQTYQWHYATVSGGYNDGTIDLCKVATGKYSRVEAEPEMVEAINNVTNAIAALEVARNAIVERKLRELRIAGMR